MAASGNGGGMVALGFFVLVFELALLIFCVRRFRITRDEKEASNCSLSPKAIWQQLYTKNHLHWKWNMLYLFNIFLAFLVVPCCIHLSSCANGHTSDACPWALADLDQTPAFKKTGIPAHGGIAFGFVAIILEMLLSVFVSVFSLRWHSESNLSPVERDGTNYLRVQLETDEDMDFEHKWTVYTRWLGFAVGCWTFVFGLVGRALVWTLMHAYVVYGVPYFDSYSYGEMIIVIIFSLMHFISYLWMCCKKTCGEDQNQNGDYAAFVCGACGGSKFVGNTEEPCPACSGNGLVYELQNSHFSPPIVDNSFPVQSIKPGGRAARDV